MPDFQTRDGTRLFYKDWGAGKPVVFVHTYVLNSDAWDYQMECLVRHGLRSVAYDRRGHGRSDRPGSGYDFDTLADDLAALIDHRDLAEITLVGHSMGAGEVARYLSRHGSARVARVLLVAPITPFMLQTAGQSRRHGSRKPRPLRRGDRGRLSACLAAIRAGLLGRRRGRIGGDEGLGPRARAADVPRRRAEPCSRQTGQPISVPTSRSSTGRCW